MATATFTTYDRLNRASSMQINVDDAVLAGDVQALTNALDAIIRGTDVKSEVSVSTSVDAGLAGPAADVDAERGNKWLFRTQASAGLDAGRIYNNTIGTALNSVLGAPGNDFIDLTAGQGLALKTAWEDIWESPIGSAGILLSVQQVTRTD